MYTEIKNISLDMKYVPNEYKIYSIPNNLEFYQYTCTNEVSKEKYLFWYTNCTPINIVIFIKRHIEY